MTTPSTTEVYWLVLTLLMTSLLWVPYIANRMTESASILYFIARATHVTVFVAGLPLLGVVTFLLGFFSQVVIALTILGII